MSDRLETGQQGRILVVLDIFTRVCLGILPALSITGKDVADELDRLARKHGYPEKVVSDSGTEFKSKAMTKWSGTS